MEKLHKHMAQLKLAYSKDMNSMSIGAPSSKPLLKPTQVHVYYMVCMPPFATNILHNTIVFLSLSYRTPNYIHVSERVTFLKYLSQEDAET